MGARPVCLNVRGQVAAGKTPVPVAQLEQLIRFSHYLNTDGQHPTAPARKRTR